MDFLKIGYIRKPHALKGEIKVLPLTNNINRYKKLSTLYLLINQEYKKVKIESIKYAPDCIILKLINHNKIEDVETLRGVYIFIDKNEGEPLKEDEYYTQDLIGCYFWYKDKCLGEVLNMFNSGSCDIFVVNYMDKEVLFPFLNQYIKCIDIKNKKIIINQFEGFFD